MENDQSPSQENKDNAKNSSANSNEQTQENSEETLKNPSQKTAESSAEKSVEQDEENNVLSFADKVKNLETQLDEANNKYFRSLADFENLKKRSAKEKQDTIKYSNESLLADMLPVLDSLDKALSESEQANVEKGAELQKCCSEVHQKWHKGTQLVRSQLLGILEKKGLKKIISLGQTFDPTYHQAIQKLEKDDVQQETVIEEFMAGYELNGRLIRPAMVLVAVPK